MGKVVYLKKVADQGQDKAESLARMEAPENPVSNDVQPEPSKQRRKKGEGSILRKKGSNKLYVSFSYYGKPVTKSLDLDDTPENRQVAEEWLKRNMEKIRNGTFRFADAFPGASEDEKKYYAEREGWDYKPEPGQVLFGDYVERWLQEVKFKSETQKEDYLEVINHWLLPHFAKMTFYQITRFEMKRFTDTLVYRRGKNKGNQLSRSRMDNIIYPLKTIWTDACDQNHWELPDPFKYLFKKLPKRKKRTFVVLRFEEWMRVLENIDPTYRNVTEFMMLTGMIASEVAGLRREDIDGDKLFLVNSVSRGREKSDLKTEYRVRTFQITEAIRRCLDVALLNTGEKYVFRMKDGSIFDAAKFRKGPWTQALKKAGVDYRKPYITRHTFAAWCLALDMDKNRLVSLLGHASKQMVYEVYGKYTDGLEKDSGKIMDYFGKDFMGL